MHNGGKFHLYSICGCHVIKFPMLLWWWSIHDMAHFGGSLRHNSPKYCPIVPKFLPEVVLEERNTMQNLWKIGIFTEAGNTQGLHIWSNFEPKLPHEDGQNPGKQKNSRQKFSHRTIQICYQHQPGSSFPLQMKNRITFCTFWEFFREN